MSATETTDSKEKINVEQLKIELEHVTAERDQYKAAYEQLAEQNANVWGLYSNTIDYVVAQTTRKQK